MPYYAKGDRVTFTGNVSAELFGMVGVVLRRRISEGHYVYDIRINAHPPINIPGFDLSAEGVIRNIPSDWVELFRG
jgi:hypothetical protein